MSAGIVDPALRDAVLRIAGVMTVPLSVDGRPIGAGRALLRTALLCLVIPAAILDRDSRGLHDKAVGSVVGSRCALAGFYSNGEISSSGDVLACGVGNQLHNQTMTITRFIET